MTARIDDATIARLLELCEQANQSFAQPYSSVFKELADIAKDALPALLDEIKRLRGELASTQEVAGERLVELAAARQEIEQRDKFLAVLDRAGLTMQGEPVSEFFARSVAMAKEL